MEYVGLEQKNTQNLPGRSFVNLLEGRDFGSDKPVYVLDEYGPTRMIRTHKWKYVHRYQHGDNELYDLENDPMKKSIYLAQTLIKKLREIYWNN